MATTLRVGFAMGGGTSLGTFSGAALSEALKLLLLYGIDGSGKPYGRVEIDVVSGASAGAMSLSVMIRGLLQDRTAAEKASLAAALAAQYGADFTSIPANSSRWNELVAAQALQEFQAEVWTRQIHLDGLISGNATALRNDPSIFDRQAVDDIARRSLKPPTTADFSARILLADRVLFACTLAGLTPMLVESGSNLPLKIRGLTAFRDAVSSEIWRDTRVFDLRFSQVVTSLDAVDDPSRWCRYHVAPKAAGLAGDLRTEDAWAAIAATAIASGAVPIAFAPVVLMRRSYEFGKTWPAALKHLDRHPFTYVDGGTFNNEPVREAYRLSAHLDARAPGNTERLIVFVDPHVTTKPPPLRIPIHREFTLKDPNRLGALDGVDLVELSSLDRLAPQAGTMLSAILGESRARETDRVFQTRKLFTIRDDARTAYLNALNALASPGPFAAGGTQPSALKGLAAFCSELLKVDQTESTFPTGALALWRELERIAGEEDPNLNTLVGRAQTFLGLASPHQDVTANLWLYALFCVATDLAMGLEGKRPTARLVSIAPFLNPGNTQQPGHVELPGGEVHGFAGFMSPAAQCYAIAVGRLCAWRFLEIAVEIEVSQASQPPSPPQWLAADEARFQAEVDAGLAKLADRVGALVKQAHFVDVLPGIDSIVVKMLGDHLAGVVRGLGRGLARRHERRTTYELRLPVPDKGFEFDGSGIGDRDIGPVTRDGRLVLITFCTHAATDGGPGTWEGPHIKDGLLHVDHDGTFVDSDFCSLDLPDAAQRAEADLQPNPMFVLDGIKKTDKGKRIPATRWTVAAGVRPLEDGFFQVPVAPPAPVHWKCP